MPIFVDTECMVCWFSPPAVGQLLDQVFRVCEGDSNGLATSTGISETSRQRKTLAQCCANVSRRWHSIEPASFAVLDRTGGDMCGSCDT